MWKTNVRYTTLEKKISRIEAEKLELHQKISDLKIRLDSTNKLMQLALQKEEVCVRSLATCTKTLQNTAGVANQPTIRDQQIQKMLATTDSEKQLVYYRNRMIDYHRDMYMARDALISIFKNRPTKYSGITLITNCPDPDGDRGVEPLAVLQLNLLNPFIEKILLYNSHKHNNITGQHFINSHKIQIVQISHRFSFGEALAYANENFPQKIVFIANMDIYFDNTLINVMDMEQKEFYSISRQRTIEGDDILMDTTQQETIFRNMCIDYMSAHDVFGGIVPFPQNLVDTMMPATLGDRGIDNMINWQFYRAGWKMRNPCSQILVHHLHGKRNHGKDHHKKTWSNFDIYLYPERHRYEKTSEKTWLEDYRQYSK
jgi:hypothetical protein